MPELWKLYHGQLVLPKLEEVAEDRGVTAMLAVEALGERQPKRTGD